MTGLKDKNHFQWEEEQLQIWICRDCSFFFLHLLTVVWYTCFSWPFNGITYSQLSHSLVWQHKQKAQCNYSPEEHEDVLCTPGQGEGVCVWEHPSSVPYRSSWTLKVEGFTAEVFCELFDPFDKPWLPAWF